MSTTFDIIQIYYSYTYLYLLVILNSCSTRCTACSRDENNNIILTNLKSISINAVKKLLYLIYIYNILTTIRADCVFLKTTRSNRMVFPSKEKPTTITTTTTTTTPSRGAVNIAITIWYVCIVVAVMVYYSIV